MYLEIQVFSLFQKNISIILPSDDGDFNIDDGDKIF